VSGDTLVCGGNTKTYTGAALDVGQRRRWSVLEPALAEIVGPVTGTTVSVHFLNEGLVHLHLQAFTSADSFDCRSECELRIHSAPPPPCGPLAGDDATCVGVLETYTSPVLTAQYIRRWFVTDPGCRIEGSALGASVNVRFTGMGTCRVQQLVVD